MIEHVPSLATLETNDDRQLMDELRLSRLRSKLAAIRALVDLIDDFIRQESTDGFGEQVVEETVRLGCELFETAASMTRTLGPDESGVFALPLPSGFVMERGDKPY
jgi:hypothetical protein